MEGGRLKSHWLNPLFKSESNSTLCSSKSACFPDKSISSSSHSSKDMKRLLRCISDSWKSVMNHPSATTFVSTDNKDVIMEGYIPPTSKPSIVNFLKGMGLKPMIQCIDKETVITADASQITDPDLKVRFIRYMKRQVAKSPKLEVPFDSSSASIVTSQPPSRRGWENEEGSCESEGSGSSQRKGILTNQNEDKKQVAFKTAPMIRIASSEGDVMSSLHQIFPDEGTVENEKVSSSTHSVQEQTNFPNPPVISENEPPADKPKKKKKKLRIMKHLRKWFSKKKKSTECVTQTTSPVTEQQKDTTVKVDVALQSRPLSNQRFDLLPTNPTVSAAPDIDPYLVIPKLDAQKWQVSARSEIKLQHDLNVEPQRNTTRNNKPKRLTKINPGTYDGSLSMPILITPDQSCFKSKTLKSNFLETSKSSTVAAPSYQPQDSYNVVGNRAVIRIGKKRIRLEGKDVKYGSILQNDEDFDKHFRAIKENSLSDIEKQVKKAKERIMFARAMGAVGDRLPNGGPKVDYKELLMPEKIKKENRKPNFDGRKDIDVATTSSFYQKFLASMNIMKTTNRTGACDRSVMTDEPLSKTYAEFINLMNDRKSKCVKPGPLSGLSQSSEKLATEDSTANITSSYLKMICTCWEPLFKILPDNNELSYNRKLPESAKTEEEKILKSIVDKVLDCSRNKKGYIKTESCSCLYFLDSFVKIRTESIILFIWRDDRKQIL